MRYVLVILSEYGDKPVDTPLIVGSSSSDVLRWFENEYPRYEKFCSGKEVKFPVVWTASALVDGAVREFACYEVRSL